MQTNRNALSSIALSIIAAGMLAVPLAAVAQTTAAAPLPPGFKVVLNDDRVSVVESTFAPGVVTPMRKYPRRTVYILKGSSELKYTYADGKTETLAQEVGTVKSRDPEMMSVTNVGTNDVVALVVVDKRDLPAK
jgi:quercetin dioxygenase-like cupin family protein